MDDQLLRFAYINSLRKVSKYGVISGPYFPVFGPEIIPDLDTFHAVTFFHNKFWKTLKFWKTAHAHIDFHGWQTLKHFGDN